MPAETFTIRAPRSSAEWEAYYALRWRTLRRPWGQPVGSERDELDATATHRAAITDGGEVIGTARLHTQAPGEGRIRYMAVEEAHRGAGTGSHLLAALIRAARAQGLSRLVLNARAEAVAFYRRNGFETVGDGPTQFGVKHVVMIKDLAPGQETDSVLARAAS